MIVFQASSNDIAVVAMDPQHFVENRQGLFGCFRVKLPDAEFGDDYLLVRNVLLAFCNVAQDHIKIVLCIGHFNSLAERHLWDAAKGTQQALIEARDDLGLDRQSASRVSDNG
ncbi:hypothetical protein [Rhizobium paranaense]|uniref:hypothetical protein n=1 Tax=Rhizobium paranaense TaxID=1650438 RepID=UPI001AEEAC82|nr:hypothetical protein [Rhizobium paranaense]